MNNNHMDDLFSDKTSYLVSYINDVLLPSSYEFMSLMEENNLRLHHAYSFNIIVAHAIDYMVFVAKKMGTASRSQFLKNFDEKYSVEGSRHINNKFRLLDAVSNSFKHVELDKKRYLDLIEQYGDINFKSLNESEGKVFFITPKYSFDYCRVVLRPVAAVFKCELNTTQDIIDFINGDNCGCLDFEFSDYDHEPHNAIDRMVEHCNPKCLDCGECGDDCVCCNFVYDDKLGKHVPVRNPAFRFDDVMSQISGNWTK